MKYRADLAPGEPLAEGVGSSRDPPVELRNRPRSNAATGQKILFAAPENTAQSIELSGPDAVEEAGRDGVVWVRRIRGQELVDDLKWVREALLRGSLPPITLKQPAHLEPREAPAECPGSPRDPFLQLLHRPDPGMGEEILLAAPEDIAQPWDLALIQKGLKPPRQRVARVARVFREQACHHDLG